jgi:hypothetical protein
VQGVSVLEIPRVKKDAREFYVDSPGRCRLPYGAYPKRKRKRVDFVSMLRGGS